MSSIRQRLRNRLLIGSAVLLLIGGGFAYFTMRAALIHQFDLALQTKAMALAAIIEQDSTGIQVDAGDPFLRAFDAGQKSEFFELWRTDGTEIARSESLNQESLKLSGTVVEQSSFWNARLSSGSPIRVVAFKFHPHPADAQDLKASVDAILAVALERGEFDIILGIIALFLVGAGLMMLILTAIAVPWFLGRELLPLNRLATETILIGPETISMRVREDGLPSEIAPIAQRLNELVQRLETALMRERQFSDDLAHELRTPVAELRSLAELALKWPKDRDPETDQEVLAIAQQMQAMINRLLAVARSEREQIRVEWQRVMLLPFVDAIVDRVRARAEARSLKIELNVPHGLEINSDPILLQSIVSNLVENAVEYSSGGTVHVQAEAQNNEFILRFINEVEGLNPTDTEHFFERFWRKDVSRTDGQHAGLGLSLAKAFATTLGYELSAKLHGDSCLTLALKGPLEPKILQKNLPITRQNDRGHRQQNENL